MSRLNDRLSLLANLAVIAGIIFLAVEMRQNTRAIEAQTRDAITEKQLTWYMEGIVSSSELAELWSTGLLLGLDSIPNQNGSRTRVIALIGANFREWENSYYQYERGLFNEAEFEPRRALWARNMTLFRSYRDVWATSRDFYSPGFRAEIDSLVSSTR